MTTTLPAPVDETAWLRVRALYGATIPDHPAHRRATLPDPARMLPRDTANLYPTVKALVDGLGDAGVLLGDHDSRVEGPWLKRTYPNGPLRLRLVLGPLPGGDGLGTPYPEENPA